MATGPSGGGGGQAGAIEAGKAVVRLGVDEAGLRSGLERARRMFLDAGKKFAIVGAGIAGVGAPVLGPILGAFHETVERITEVRKASEKLGTSTDTFSALGYAAKKSGVDTDGLVAASRKYLAVISEAAHGNTAAAEALAQVGLDAKDLIDLPLDEKFAKLADGISSLGNEADQIDLTKKILGRGGQDLVVMLKKGSSGLAEMQAKAKKLGLVVNPEDAKNAKIYTGAIAQAKDAVHGLVEAVGASLLPQAAEIKKWSDVFVDGVVQLREFIEDNREAVVAVAAGAAGVVAFGAALVGVGSALAAASFAIGGLISAAGVAASVLAAVFSPLGLGIAAVAVAGVVAAALVAELVDWTAVVEILGPMWSGFVGEVMKGLGAIKNALGKGDFKLAWQIAVAGLDVIWKGLLLGVTVAWVNFKEDFVDGWHSAMTEVKVLMVQFLDFVRKQFGDIFNDNRLGRFVKDNPELFGAIGVLAQVDKAGLTEEKVRDQARADQAERDKARAKQMLDAAKDLVNAKKELADLEQKAQPGPIEQGPMPREVKKRVADAVAAITEIRGGFGTQNVRGRFGAGATGDKQLKKLEDIDNKLGQIRDRAGGIFAD